MNKKLLKLVAAEVLENGNLKAIEKLEHYELISVYYNGLVKKHKLKHNSSKKDLIKVLSILMSNIE